MITYAEILIIDDSPENIALTSAILQAEGYRTFAATSGQAVRRFFETRVPHLVLLDIQMQDTSGLEVCRKIKDSPRAKDVPVIFLTSQTDVDVISKGFELGASDYIKQPFVREEFLARVRTHIRISMQRKELVAANDELTQFCAAVTHDLKAPFTLINQLVGALAQEMDTLFQGAVPQEVSTLMDIIRTKTDQAGVMISRLFDFSKMCNVRPQRRRTTSTDRCP